MYWREYRTEAHIAQTYGVHESTVCRTTHAVEAALMRSGGFRLPGRKALTKSDVQYQVVVMDATECPVERPQKSSAEKKAAPKKKQRRKKSSAEKKAAPKLQRQEEAPYHPNKAHSRPR